MKIQKHFYITHITDAPSSSHLLRAGEFGLGLIKNTKFKLQSICVLILLNDLVDDNVMKHCLATITAQHLELLELVTKVENSKRSATIGFWFECLFPCSQQWYW